VIRHEEGVDVGVVATVVTSPKALTHEPERFVQPNCRLVPREDVELELPDPGAARPGHGRVEEEPADSTSSVLRRHDKAEIGHVGARRVRVARDREAGDDAPAVDGDEDRGIGMAANGAQIPALVGGVPPRVGRQQPLARLVPDRRRECDQVVGIRGLGPANLDQWTMHP